MGRTALVHSANFGHVSVVRILIQAGARLNQADPTNRCTALAAAAYAGHADVAQQAPLFFPHEAFMQLGQQTMPRMREHSRWLWGE